MIQNRNPKISIIMNAHNGEKYLRESISSILSQTYTNWELIFLNNCSTDNSEKIVKEYQISDNRIKYFKSSKFLKLYKARNDAIKKANGNFIAFLDTDDWWTNDKLAVQVLLIKKNPGAKFIYSNLYIFDQTKKKSKLISESKLNSGSITNSLLKRYTVGVLTALIDINILKKNKFNENYNIIGDFDLFIRLSLK